MKVENSIFSLINSPNRKKYEKPFINTYVDVCEREAK